MANPVHGAAAALMLAACSPAPSPPAIHVTDAWARASMPGQSSGAVYATIANDGGSDDRLVAVSTSVGQAMLHTNDASGGMARMRAMSDLPVAAGQRVTLSPGGTHVMIGGLAAPLVAGGAFEARFRFARSGWRAVRVAIVAPGAR